MNTKSRIGLVFGVIALLFVSSLLVAQGPDLSPTDNPDRDTQVDVEQDNPEETEETDTITEEQDTDNQDTNTESDPEPVTATVNVSDYDIYGLSYNTDITVKNKQRDMTKQVTSGDSIKLQPGEYQLSIDKYTIIEIQQGDTVASSTTLNIEESADSPTYTVNVRDKRGTSTGESGCQTFNLEGSGTESSPYKIANYSDLICFLQDSDDIHKKYYELTGDIDAYSSRHGDGLQSTLLTFRGELDGNGYEIRGLRSTHPPIKILGDDGVIKNIGLVGSQKVPSTQSSSGILVRWNTGTIKNVYVRTNYAYKSGLGNRISHGGTLENSYVSVNSYFTSDYYQTFNYVSRTDATLKNVYYNADNKETTTSPVYGTPVTTDEMTGESATQSMPELFPPFTPTADYPELEK